MSYNSILASAPLTTQNYHLKMIGTTIGNSLIWDNGTNVGIGNTNTSYTLDVSGTGRFTSTLLVSGATTSNKFISNATSDGSGQYFWLTGSSAVSENFSIYGYSNNVYLNAYSNLVLRANQLGGSGGYIQLIGGNVGIGTSSPYSVLDIKTATTGSQKLFSVGEPTYEASNYGLVLRGDNNTGAFSFYGVNATVETTNPILTMKRSSGNVGIGTSSPNDLLEIKSTTANQANVRLYNTFNDGSNNYGISWFRNYDSATNSQACFINYIREGGSGGYMSFGTGTVGSITSRMVITSGGNVLIGLTSDSGRKLQVEGTNTPLLLHKTNNVSGSYCNIWQLGGSETNATSSYYLYCDTDFVGVRMVIYGNGNLANINGTYGTYSSDIRLKENIIPATSKLEDLMKLNVVNFNFKEDENKMKQIGFIAQEMQEVFPSFVYENDTRKYDEDGNVISGLEDSLGLKVGMEFAILVKAIQELKAEIDELKNK